MVIDKAMNPRLFSSVTRGLRCINIIKRQVMTPIVGQEFAPDFLLHEADLVKEDETFLKIINEEEFKRKFGDFPSVIEVYTPDDFLRRLAVVLPLQVSYYKFMHKVIPIPFILDTGDPESLYLGTGAVHNLTESKLLKDTSGRWPYRLLGTLCRGEKKLVDPFVNVLPIHFEEATIRGDVRLNVLGLSAIKKLELLKY